jgi:hypothetical protein
MSGLLFIFFNKSYTLAFIVIIQMKELTLINRYHQTEERPNPPVEQRVKVMDTLDKKMQTILERKDLSADKRLKRYDQSFTRYLNVYDDYRPRPVAVASFVVRSQFCQIH